MAFLFKLLAVDKALSIQAHPHKSLAEQLHATHPDIYKDDNHKPEIAIALGDDFSACFGFLTAARITENFTQNPKLAEAMDYKGEEINEEFLKKSVYRMFYEIDKDLEGLEQINQAIGAHIESLSPETRSEHQKLFLLLREQYGNKDIGLLFIFFLNYMKAKRGEAVVITPNEPHAYITGDLVECMANSDNVVRGGLTPKLKDKDTLYQMLPYSTMNVERSPVHGNTLYSSPGCDVLEYKTGFEEFKVLKIEVKPGQTSGDAQLRFKTFSMAVILSGSGIINFPGFSPSKEEFNNFKIEANCAYYILPEVEFNISASSESSENLVIFIATCDI